MAAAKAGAAPASAAPAAIPGLRSLLGLAVAVVVVSALYFAREVLVPFTLAILLSFVLAPLVNLLRRLHLGRVPSVLLAVVLALSVILMLGGLIGTQIASLVGDIPTYKDTVEKKVDTVRNFTIGRISSLADQFAMPAAQHPAGSPATPATTPSNARGGASRPAPPSAPGSGSGSSALSGASAPNGTSKPVPVPVEVEQGTPSPMQLASTYLSPVLSPIATTGIIFIVAIFVLLQREDVRDRLIRLFGASDLHQTTAAMDDVGRRLSNYFVTQLAINAGFGVVIGLGLFFIGVPSPLLWGIMSMLLRFVPYIGSFIAGLLPAALAAAVDPGWSMAIWTVGLYVVVESVTGQAIEPLVYGHSTGLSPLSVVVAAIFWSWLWGPIGLILSTPLTLCLVSVGRHVEQLEFLDVLLGDRPALTPVESFYQRMLADDPDEVQEHAELMLKEQPLSTYYDEVALKGLQLAAADAERGALSDARLERFRNAIHELVEELSSHDDVAPPPSKKSDHGDVISGASEPTLPQAPPGMAPLADSLPPAWRSANPVMCVAGRGVLDEAAAEMLAQLLSKHGLQAKVIGPDQVSRGNINTLDVSGVAMICICYLEIGANTAHLRFLIRRLRERTGSVPVLVGLWPANEAAIRNPTIRTEIAADYNASSLREAVRCCLRAAQKASEQASDKQAA